MNKEKLIEAILSEGVMQSENSKASSSFEVGEKVFIRCVTFHHVGEVVACDGVFVTLKDAAWVADSGRFSVALETGELDEVEQIKNGNVRVAIAAIVDVFEWNHALPVATK